MRTKWDINKCKERLGEISPNIELLSVEYINANTPLKCKCKVCGYEWKATWGKLGGCVGRKPSGCPNCLNCKKHTLDEVKEQCELINPNIEITSKEYVNAQTKLECRCKLCGETFFMRWKHLKQGHGCKSCNYSRGEAKVNLFLKNHNIDFIAQKTFDGLIGLKGGLLSYDFYLPKINICIEFQGEQHEKPMRRHGDKRDYETFLKQQEHDNRKRRYCEDNDIKLIEIWYYEINDIDEILRRELKIA